MSEEGTATVAPDSKIVGGKVASPKKSTMDEGHVSFTAGKGGDKTALSGNASGSGGTEQDGEPAAIADGVGNEAEGASGLAAESGETDRAADETALSGNASGSGEIDQDEDPVAIADGGGNGAEGASGLAGESGEADGAAESTANADEQLDANRNETTEQTQDASAKANDRGEKAASASVIAESAEVERAGDSSADSAGGDHTAKGVTGRAGESPAIAVKCPVIDEKSAVGVIADNEGGANGAKARAKKRVAESDETAAKAKKKVKKRKKNKTMVHETGSEKKAEKDDGGSARKSPKSSSKKSDKKEGAKRSKSSTRHKIEASNEGSARKRGRTVATKTPPVRQPTDADRKAATKIEFTEAIPRELGEKLKFAHVVDIAECSIQMGILLLLCGWMPGVLNVEQGTVEFLPCGPRVNRNVSQGDLIAEILQTFVGNPADLPDRTDNPRFDDDKPVLILSSMVSFIDLYVANGLFVLI